MNQRTLQALDHFGGAGIGANVADLRLQDVEPDDLAGVQIDQGAVDLRTGSVDHDLQAL